MGMQVRVRNIAVALVIGLLSAGMVMAELSHEGSAWQDFAARTPPQPSEVTVAVLPFSVPVGSNAFGERVRELPRACVLLNVQRHGFSIVPPASSLESVLSETNRAAELPRVRKVTGPHYSREEAQQLGQKLGARWLLYGEFGLDLDLRVTGGLFVRMKGYYVLDLHVVLLDVQSGEVLYWRRVRDETRCKNYLRPTPEDEKQARALLVDITNGIFDDLAKALPKHAVGAAVKREELDRVIGAMGL